MKKTIALKFISLILAVMTMIAMLSGCLTGKDSNKIGYIKSGSQYGSVEKQSK